MKMKDYWNVYQCGLCEVEFAVKKTTDKGMSSCPKCESGEEVYLLTKDFNDKKLIESLKEFKKAYSNLTESLSQVQTNPNHFDSIAGVHYPFEQSFDEINIPEWVDISVSNLESKNMKE